jgi:hypothetical protein
MDTNYHIDLITLNEHLLSQNIFEFVHVI